MGSLILHFLISLGHLSGFIMVALEYALKNPLLCVLTELTTSPGIDQLVERSSGFPF